MYNILVKPDLLQQVLEYMFHNIFKQETKLSEATEFPYSVKITVPSGNPTISTDNLCDLLENCFTMRSLTCVLSDVNLQIGDSI